MSHEDLPQFVPEGSLDEHPLPLLIAQILDEKLFGMLHLESEDANYWVYFEEGFPAGVHNPKSQDFLGSVLRELNYIDDSAFNNSLMAMAKEKKLQGQVLLDLGLIDDDKLDRGLSLQLARKLSRLFAIRTGTYVFAEGEEMPPPAAPIRVNPYALIYNAIKNTYGPEDLKQGLGALIGKAIKASRLFVERGPLFEFPEDDLADAKLLQDFRLPQDFVRGARGGTTAAMMMLLALYYCNMLEFEEADFAQPMPGTKAPAAAPKPRPAAASAQPMSPAAQAAQRAAQGGPTPAAQRLEAIEIPESLRKKIDEKFEQVKTAEPWEILEVEHDADSTRAKKSFLTLAKVYHPDRVAGADDEEIKHRMDVILAKVNGAYQIMSNPQAKLEYMKQSEGKNKDGPPVKGGEPRPEEAKIQFQKAMFYLKKRDFVKAAESLRWAVDMDPKQGNYLAWRIWVDYQRGEESESIKLQTAKGDLLALTKQDPESFHAARFLSKLYMQLNDMLNYEKFLVRANRLNPKDVETTRDLRLYRARKEKEAKKGSFLGIKFKK